MKLSAMLVFFVSCCAFAQSDQAAVVNIYKADTALISGKLVRYYQMFDSPCIQVQILKPGGNGIANNTKEFCSISGKSFTSDYSEIWLEKGEFSSDELNITLKLLSLSQDKEQVGVCKFKVKDGAISEPVCTIK